MNTNDKPLKAVALTNVDEQMQDIFNAATNEHIHHKFEQKDKTSEIQALYKEVSSFGEDKVAAIREIKEVVVSSITFNTCLEENSTENKGVSQPMEETAFNMDDLLLLLDELWPLEETRIKSIKQAEQLPSGDFNKSIDELGKKRI